MSIARCELMRNGRSASSDEKFQRSYTVKWLVTTTSASDGPAYIYANAAGASPDPIPAKYSTYSINGDVDPNAYHLTSTIEPYDAGTEFQWVVTVNFGPAPEGEPPGDRKENPLDRPVRYSIDWVAYVRPLIKDINGNLIVNAAKQAFDPPPEQEDLRPVLVAKKNFGTLSEVIGLMRTYKNAVNTDNFYGAGEREAKVESITAGDQQHENGVSYYEATIRVMFNEPGEKFDRLFVNQGYKHYTSATDKTLVIGATKGVPYNEPVLLAEDGTRLPDNTDGNSLEFRTFPEVAFDGLGI